MLLLSFCGCSGPRNRIVGNVPRGSVKFCCIVQRRNTNERVKNFRARVNQKINSPSFAAFSGCPMERRIDSRFSRTSSPIDTHFKYSLR